MEYLSKTYRLDEQVVDAIQRAKAGGTSPNQFLRMLMGLDSSEDVGGSLADAPVGEPPSTVKPSDIPGVTQGVTNLPPRKETANERVARERAEKEARIRARSSIGDDPSFVADPEYAQD